MHGGTLENTASPIVVHPQRRRVKGAPKPTDLSKNKSISDDSFFAKVDAMIEDTYIQDSRVLRHINDFLPENGSLRENSLGALPEQETAELDEVDGDDTLFKVANSTEHESGVYNDLNISDIAVEENSIEGGNVQSNQLEEKAGEGSAAEQLSFVDKQKKPPAAIASKLFTPALKRKWTDKDEQHDQDKDVVSLEPVSKRRKVTVVKAKAKVAISSPDPHSFKEVMNTLDSAIDSAFDTYMKKSGTKFPMLSTTFLASAKDQQAGEDKSKTEFIFHLGNERTSEQCMDHPRSKRNPVPSCQRNYDQQSNHLNTVSRESMNGTKRRPKDFASNETIQQCDVNPTPVRHDFDPQVHVPSPSYHHSHHHDHATINSHVEGAPYNDQRSTCIDNSNLRTSHNSAFDEVRRGFEVYEDYPRSYHPSVVYETHHHHHSGGTADSQILSLAMLQHQPPRSEHFQLAETRNAVIESSTPARQALEASISNTTDPIKTLHTVMGDLLEEENTQINRLSTARKKYIEKRQNRLQVEESAQCLARSARNARGLSDRTNIIYY